MERRVLDIIEDLLESRNHFFTRSSVLNGNRDLLASQVINNESIVLSLLSNLLLTRRPLTITFPLNLDSFNEPVLITPTQQQINNELVPITTNSQQSCSICQEQITGDGCELRGCNHAYHRNCITTWFSASVRCPICRRDIREDPQSQTSSEHQ
jgi:hypothetical protein